MPSASLDNVGGHRSKYEMLKAGHPKEDVGKLFVGGSDPVLTGYVEVEKIKRLHSLAEVDVIDIGCGIGRLARHLMHEPIRSYLGTEIIPEIMAEAIALTEHDARFKFTTVTTCSIPSDDACCDLVVAFSVITHLLDEEIYEYIAEAKRVLRPGGLAIFSFLDFTTNSDLFFRHAAVHRGGHGDLLKFTTQDVLTLFAKHAGMSSVEFEDGQDTPTSGRRTPAMEGYDLPPAVALNHPLCVMRA
jgi:2-polyprenyl-3-methyl-5-hydroxy-6-metoxy-1,4-benzoquinol methylase